MTHAIGSLLAPAVLLAGLALSGCNTLPPASPEQVAALQGTYAGVAIINDPALPGPVCAPELRIVGFTVAGNQASFGEFSGTIRDDGSLEMVSRRSWIIGRFVPGGFVGQVIVPPTDLCVYRVSLSRSP